jgi:hypothetical protein
MTLRLLLNGFDTIECAYYFAFDHDCVLDFEQLAIEKEALRQSKTRKPKHIKLGSEEFLLASHGTGSGYPFLIENESFSIQFGEFNQPSFFVTFRSVALWHSGILYGYLKRMAAIQCLQYGKENISVTEAQALMNMIIRHVHDPLSWPLDVEERVTEMKLGQW